MTRFGSIVAAAVLGLAALAGVARAQPATVVLVNDDVLQGDIVSNDGETIVLSHSLLGVIPIPAENVSQLFVAPEGELAPKPAPPVVGEEAVEEAAAVEEAVEETKPEDPWSLSIGVGLDGSEGNTERFSGRFSFGAIRETEAETFTFRTSYYRASEDGEKTADRWNTRVLNEWNLGDDSPWLLYAQAEADYDDFKDYDWRLSGSLGVGYKFIDTENTELVGRIGPGLAYEFGVEDEEIIPELFAGLDFRHKIDDRQNINAYVYYTPDLSEFDNYLIRSGAHWEYLIAEDGSLTLQIGFEDRYDNMVDPGTEKNDLDYYATINWNF